MDITFVLRLRYMITCLLVAGSVSASIQLDIPPREQWDNSNGYCGECSIQQAALHYGTYISQYRAREIIDPTQRQDLWVPDHSGQVFEALRLNYQNWNSAAAQPQYPAYLIWTKAHLQQGHPVIITVFVRGESDSSYDHIIPATGFTSTTTNTYISSDTLVFNDCYDTSPYTRTFGSLWATRSSANSGSYEYYVPQNVDYGCAVTGVKDSTGTLLPLSLKLNRWNEPNISQGAAAVTMTATIRVRALTTGNSYALLRYNTYSSVPTSGYLSSAYSALTLFTATNTTHNLTDSFLSDKIVIYRCVPYSAAAPEMDVRGNAVSVADGDAAPTAADHTDFGGALVAGGTVTRTFTVYNTGAAALNLTGTPKVAVGGTHAAEFAVTIQPASPVAATSGTTTFQVTFDPAAAGTRSATLSIANNDADENPYNFSIQGAGTAPEMDVRGNAVSVADGDAAPTAADHTDFGGALVAGGTVTRTFTVYNTGAAALNLTGTPKVAVGGTHAAEFAVTVLPASPVAATSGTTTFQVTFDPAAAGTRSATLSIANNDADENPYNFSIQGAGTAAAVPETKMQDPLLVANGRAVLRWSSVSNSLYTVHRSTNLVSGFSVLTNHIPATPPLNTYTDVVNHARMRFWKITKE